MENLRHAADVGPSVGLVSIDHSSLSKHMKALNDKIVKRFFEGVTSKFNRAARRTLKMLKTLLSIDSITVTVGKTRLKHDGPIGENLEDQQFILVCDRAYFSIDKVDRYVTSKERQHFVIRLKDNLSSTQS